MSALGWILLALLAGVLGFLLCNVLYMRTTQYKNFTAQAKRLRALAAQAPYDAAVFGSLYARDAADFADTGVRGANFGYASQFFFYTERMLWEFAPCIRPGGTVLLAVPDMVFMETGEAWFGGAEPYYHLLSPANLPGYSRLKALLYTRFPLLVNLKRVKFLLHDDAPVPPVGDGAGSLAKAEAGAKKRTASWRRLFHLQNTTDPVGAEKAPVFAQTAAILARMARFCREKGLRPVLFVPPVSEPMNALISDAFIESALYANLRGIDAPLLNYLRAPALQDPALYYNADCLNAAGRRAFTAVLCKDAGLMEAEA